VRDLDGSDVEVDVLVETLVNEQIAVRIVFECKDHKRPIERRYIDAFFSNCERIPADKKVFVSSNGFQAGAKTRARQFNIELLELRRLTDDDDDMNANRIRELFALLSVRTKIVAIGVYCPAAPASLAKIPNLYRRDRTTTIPTLDLAQQLVRHEPPPTDAIQSGQFADIGRRFEFITAFRMPMRGGVGTVGSVVSSKSGKVQHFFQLPRGQKAASGESYCYIKYQLPGSFEIREVTISCNSALDASGNLPMTFNLKFIPEGSAILDARLFIGRVPSIDWNVTSIAAVHEGPDNRQGIDDRNWYFGDDHAPYDFRELLREAIVANPPPHHDMSLGVVRSVDMNVKCSNGTLFLRIDGNFYRILEVRATIDYRRLPDPLQRDSHASEAR
jgi:hypothetical protein